MVRAHLTVAFTPKGEAPLSPGRGFFLLFPADRPGQFAKPISDYAIQSAILRCRSKTLTTSRAIFPDAKT